jgi:hypothetical protein
MVHHQFSLISVFSCLCYGLQLVAGESKILAKPTSGNSSGPPYTVCDSTCQRQVKILEGLIVFFVFASAMTIAVLFMHSVSTPTRFGTPKDQRSHQE